MSARFQMTRIKLIKGFVVVLVVAFLGGVMVLAGGWFMLRGTPEWYKPDTIAPQERQIAARNAEDMFTRMTNWAASARARRIRAGLTTTQANIAMAHEPSQPFQIQFTDEELNAFFDKWADLNGRREFFEQYVEDPRLVLRNNLLILAGSIKEMNMVVSMEFTPRIDERGRLQMDLVRVLGGILPMPSALWARPRERIGRLLESRLPIYQNSATIAADGTANASASAAGMNKLLLAVLNGNSADPVLFVPYDLRNLNRTLPVKITAVSIENNMLTVTAEQMTSVERSALVGRLRAPYEPATMDATVR
jgi:hypothetical protein